MNPRELNYFYTTSTAIADAVYLNRLDVSLIPENNPETNFFPLHSFSEEEINHCFPKLFSALQKAGRLEQALTMAEFYAAKFPDNHTWYIPIFGKAIEEWGSIDEAGRMLATYHKIDCVDAFQATINVFLLEHDYKRAIDLCLSVREDGYPFCFEKALVTLAEFVMDERLKFAKEKDCQVYVYMRDHDVMMRAIRAFYLLKDCQGPEAVAFRKRLNTILGESKLANHAYMDYVNFKLSHPHQKHEFKLISVHKKPVTGKLFHHRKESIDSNGNEQKNIKRSSI